MRTSMTASVRVHGTCLHNMTKIHFANSMRGQPTSTLSSSGFSLGEPSSSEMQTWTTGSLTTDFLYSSAIRRVMPSVRFFRSRSAASLSPPLSLAASCGVKLLALRRLEARSQLPRQ